jgi:aryl-alcohol dehydrogenase-like predicted oxidoreductase
MQQNQLGNSDIKVSKICLGTMTFGEQNTEAEGHEQMDYALANGVNFIDTAEMYSVPGSKETQGSTERIIGTWMNARKNREKFVLATKATGPSPHFQKFMRPLNFKPESIRTALAGSFERLQTDYIDVYQLHWPERTANFFGKRGYKHTPSDEWEDNFLSVIETMQALKKEGKIREWGVSNETAWGLMHYLQLADKHDLPRPVSIQNPYGLLNRTYEVGLAEVSIRENVGLLTYSPMGFGLLSGKFHKKEDTKASRINKFKQMSRYNKQQSWDATTKYLEIAEKHGLSLAQMSLAFVNDQVFNASTIIGATNMEQLKENIGSADITLSDEILKEIEEVQELIPNPAP